MLSVVSWEIVQVHRTSIRIIRQDVFVESSDLCGLIDMSLHVDVVFIHHLTSQFHKLNVAFAHVHKNRGSCDNQTDVNSHEISRKGVDGLRADVKLSL
jgi:hypothetical protein